MSDKDFYSFKKECNYECTELIKTKETFVKKPSLKQVSIISIETEKFNECDNKFKKIRNLKNH